MKAILITKYGEPLKVLQLKEVEKPVPAENRVLVKVQAASVNVADLGPVKGPFVARLLGTGMLRPKQNRPGTDVAGRVEAVGPNVTRFKTGDEVFGAAAGSYAEYVLAKEDNLVPKPANVSFEAAAAVPVAAISALQGLRFGGIQAGQKVLIYGASGGVGTYAVQIAKAFGAEVTAVTSPRNLDQARTLGADHVIDYTQEDFAKSGQTYDLILAVNGHHSIAAYRRALSPTGHCVIVGGSLRQVLGALTIGSMVSKKDGQKIGMMGIAKINQADLLQLKEMLESGKIKPLVEKTYPLSQTAEAVAYVDGHHARAKVVITVE